ncbi:decaprenyl-phosphate phosphoribosyltransferase [uncultured Amnibacterium sp.]|uniref:decaprenyl-phosphate phosphoribosyltransferase n=1 Tax=uncultured Amnibacterium sp. TaxID=1631851 RepID=UPI0035CAE9A5
MSDQTIAVRGVEYATRDRAIGLVLLMRPKQWIKNLFVFMPLLFARQFLNPVALADAIAAFALFCVASSATYIVNDIRDREADRLHPTKSNKRPIASGRVTVRASLALLGVLYAVLLVGLFLHPAVLAVIAGYLLLNVAYSFYLKHQPVLDIFTIALGFVLRVIAGAVAINTALSSWMFITTLCLALYLAAVKRRQEYRGSGSGTRAVLGSYSLPLIDRYAEMAAIGAVIFYSLFVVSVPHRHMTLTIPFVLFGLFRYWYVVEVKEGGESPTDALVGDWQLVASVAAWATICIWALWPTPIFALPF